MIKSLIRNCFVLAAVGLIVSESVLGKDERIPAKPVEAPAATSVSTQLVWPPPPLEPRIRYLKSIATSDDIRGEKGFWRKFWEFFRGPEVHAMIKPMAVVADSKGRIYVADPAAKRIHVFNLARKKYRFIETVDKQFLQFPINIALDDEDNLYIVDGQRRRVFAVTPQGKLKQIYGQGGQLQRPSGIAIDPMHKVLYVADPPAHDIKVFSLKDGKQQKTIGKRGVQPGEFNFPTWLAVDTEGHLYVTDSLNGRVQVLTRDGKPLSSIGKLGDSTGSFSSPKGIALDSDGHLYVTDAGFDNTQIFDETGRLLLYFGGSGQMPGLFWMPAGIFIDRNDKIYIADSYNRRVQIFQYLKVKGSP